MARHSILKQTKNYLKGACLRSVTLIKFGAYPQTFTTSKAADFKFDIQMRNLHMGNVSKTDL